MIIEIIKIRQRQLIIAISSQYIYYRPIAKLVVTSRASIEIICCISRKISHHQTISFDNKCCQIGRIQLTLGACCSWIFHFVRTIVRSKSDKCRIMSDFIEIERSRTWRCRSKRDIIDTNIIRKVEFWEEHNKLTPLAIIVTLIVVEMHFILTFCWWECHSVDRHKCSQVRWWGQYTNYNWMSITIWRTVGPAPEIQFNISNIVNLQSICYSISTIAFFWRNNVQRRLTCMLIFCITIRDIVFRFNIRTYNITSRMSAFACNIKFKTFDIIIFNRNRSTKSRDF